jgi:hypothetical protein
MGTVAASPMQTVKVNSTARRKPKARETETLESATALAMGSEMGWGSASGSASV